VRVLGKTGIEVFEYPGYVTTRVMLPFLNEAMHVVMEGVATAEAVDTSMKLGYQLPIGPLAWLVHRALAPANRVVALAAAMTLGGGVPWMLW